MQKKYTISIPAIVVTLILGNIAYAGDRIEKVDMVKEGIDLTPVIVRSNSGGYTTYENNTHTYSIRVFAKAKGSNRVVEAQLTGLPSPILEVHSNPIYFHQKNHKDGWGVYKTSLTPNQVLGDVMGKGPQRGL